MGEGWVLGVGGWDGEGGEDGEGGKAKNKYPSRVRRFFFLLTSSIASGYSSISSLLDRLCRLG